MKKVLLVLTVFIFVVGCGFPAKEVLKNYNYSERKITLEEMGIYEKDETKKIPINRSFTLHQKDMKVKHIVDGKVVYTACGIGSNNFLDDYSEEEYEAAKMLKFLAETDYQKFEAVIAGMNGATEQEIYARNHSTPTIYFKYERVLDGSPDREFCDSIEGRYFRRLEIDLLKG